MPNVRRLAYRDRYVWELIQTIDGGSSLLPPLQFSPSVETPVLVSWTEEQWNRVFSALITGADLSYPEQSHQVVWDLLKYVEYPLPIQDADNPARINMLHRFSAVSAGAITVSYPTFLTLQNCVQTEAANSRQFTDKVFLSPGTWEYRFIYPKSTDAGLTQIDLLVPGGGTVSVAVNLDQFGLFNAEFIYSATVTITVRGFYTLRLANFGTKNASSSGFRVNATSSHFWRDS